MCRALVKWLKGIQVVVAHDMQRRFNVSEAVEEQNVAIFATILDPHYHQLKFMDDKNIKVEAYSIFKEQLVLMISEEECQVVKEVAVESPKKREKNSIGHLTWRR